MHAILTYCVNVHARHTANTYITNYQNAHVYTVYSNVKKNKITSNLRVLE